MTSAERLIGGRIMPQLKKRASRARRRDFRFPAHAIKYDLAVFESRVLCQISESCLSSTSSRRHVTKAIRIMIARQENEYRQNIGVQMRPLK